MVLQGRGICSRSGSREFSHARLMTFSKVLMKMETLREGKATRSAGIWNCFILFSRNAAGMQPWHLPTAQEARAFSRTDIFSWAGCKLCAACCQQFWHYVNKMKLVFGIPGSQKAYGAGNTSSWWSWQRGQLPTVTESGLKVMSTWCSNSKKEWRLFSTYILK